MNDPAAARTVLIVGASRGLGHALAQGFVEQEWQVIGTVRSGAPTALHDLADACPGRVTVEKLDITAGDQIAALRQRLEGRRIDVLFVNAGTTTQDEHVRIGTVEEAEFNRVMVTNALSPMRVVEALGDLVPQGGVVGVMSSGQGSIANNETGLREVYRASKAALNMLMRSYAAREADRGRALLLLAPGWIRTDLGGPDALFTIEETVPALLNVILSRQGEQGLVYLDRFGRTVPW